MNGKQSFGNCAYCCSIVSFVLASSAIAADKVADPSESTCVAYMEADQRYDEVKRRHRETQRLQQRIAIGQDDSSETMSADEVRVLLSGVSDDDLERAKKNATRGVCQRLSRCSQFQPEGNGPTVERRSLAML